MTTSADLADQVSGSLSSASDLADRLGTWLAVAALVASFAVAGLLTVSAVSRRVREFGTLKALGWKSRRIVVQVLGESFVVGLVGAVLGVALGIAGARLIVAFSPALKATVGNTFPAPEGARGGMGGALRALGGAAQTVDRPAHGAGQSATGGLRRRARSRRRAAGRRPRWLACLAAPPGGRSGPGRLMGEEASSSGAPTLTARREDKA